MSETVLVSSRIDVISHASTTDGIFILPFTNRMTFLSVTPDSPTCRDGQKNSYASSIGETIAISCDVDSSPTPVMFYWIFNSSQRGQAHASSPSVPVMGQASSISSARGHVKLTPLPINLDMSFTSKGKNKYTHSPVNVKVMAVNSIDGSRIQLPSAVTSYSPSQPVIATSLSSSSPSSSSPSSSSSSSSLERQFVSFSPLSRQLLQTASASMSQVATPSEHNSNLRHSLPSVANNGMHFHAGSNDSTSSSLGTTVVTPSTFYQHMSNQITETTHKSIYQSSVSTDHQENVQQQRQQMQQAGHGQERKQNKSNQVASSGAINGEQALSTENTRLIEGKTKLSALSTSDWTGTRTKHTANELSSACDTSDSNEGGKKCKSHTNIQSSLSNVPKKQGNSGSSAEGVIKYSLKDKARSPDESSVNVETVDEINNQSASKSVSPSQDVQMQDRDSILYFQSDASDQSTVSSAQSDGSHMNEMNHDSPSKPGGGNFQEIGGTGSGSKLKYVSEGTRSWLYITPKSREDYGVFECWATNLVGKQVKPCVFTVTPVGK